MFERTNKNVFYYQSKHYKMWGVILRGIVTAVGWLSGGYAISDIYNEKKRKQQFESSAEQDPAVQETKRKKYRTIALAVSAISLLIGFGMWLYTRKTAKK